jgi:tetratricopeptide (TPR) repeat protein
MKSKSKRADAQRGLEDDKYFLALADELFQQGKFSQAVAYYDIVLEKVPDNFRALHNKGLALFALNKFDKSIECYDKALEVQPDALHVKLKKAVSLNSKRDFKRAKDLLDSMLTVDCTNKEALNARALAEFHLGLDSEGMQDLRRAIQIDPTYVMAWNNLGCFYLGLGELDAAVACFDRALTIDAGCYDALLLKDMAAERREKRTRRA